MEVTKSQGSRESRGSAPARPTDLEEQETDQKAKGIPEQGLQPPLPIPSSALPRGNRGGTGNDLSTIRSPDSTQGRDGLRWARAGV